MQFHPEVAHSEEGQVVGQLLENLWRGKGMDTLSFVKSTEVEALKGAIGG